MLQKQLAEQIEQNNELHRVIENLQMVIDGLNQKIKELEERLNKNSKNSSKPPSSGGLSKPAPKSLREPSGKKPGGQAGHPGSSLNATALPDEIIRHAPAACLNCPGHDGCIGRASIGETRQVVDAVVTVSITAHQSLVIGCPRLGARQKGEFPDNIRAAVQYGENLQALAVAMNTVGAVSVGRTHEILSGVFGIPLSTGTISNMAGRCADNLTGVLESIRQKLTAAGVVHFDETGTRAGGKAMWVHNASAPDYTHLTINANRGQEGMSAGGVLPGFAGKAVHDCWAAYWKFINIILHALCCAHLLRELIAAKEREPAQEWAGSFKKLLLDMKGAREQAIAAGEWQLSGGQLSEFDRRYDQIIAQSYKENPLPAPDTTGKKRGRQKKGKNRALAERLDKHKASVCLFVHDFAVPFDNNQAERDIRMIKTKTKVSGCFRSMTGAENYLKIMSYVGTAKKHGISAYEAIREAIAGNPEYIFAREF
jgi:transposase